MLTTLVPIFDAEHRFTGFKWPRGIAMQWIMTKNSINCKKNVVRDAWFVKWWKTSDGFTMKLDAHFRRWMGGKFEILHSVCRLSYIESIWAAILITIDNFISMDWLISFHLHFFRVQTSESDWVHCNARI